MMQIEKTLCKREKNLNLNEKILKKCENYKERFELETFQV